eukprot:gene26344-47629_t
MHGRKKSLIPPSEAEIEAQEKKKNGYISLTKAIFDKREEYGEAESTMILSSKLLKQNPDVYT